MNKTFAQLKELGGLKAAMALGAGRECCGCLPYLKLVFKTGETEFAVEDPRIDMKDLCRD
jgi:hypothetical protein